MRPLEVLVVAASLAAIVPLLLAPAASGRRVRVFSALALLGLAAAQVRLSGARREMLPAYLAVAALLACAAWSVRAGTRARYAVALLETLLLGLAVAASVAFPVFELPEPTGPDAIGTVLLSSPPLQIWYPAKPGSAGTRASYTYAGLEPTLGSRFARERLVQTPALIGAPVAPGAHPLVLYAAGWGGKRADNTVQALELASHGYIVAAMDDRYPQPPLDFSSPGAARDTVRWATRKVGLEASLARGALDALRALDARDPQGRFTGRIDLAREGMFGFSFGGAVAAETARLDPRIRAAVDLDGWIFGEAAQKGVVQPFFIISGPIDDVSPVTDPALRYSTAFDRADDRLIFRGLRRHGGYLLVVDGTVHANFVDWALYSSQRWRPGAGGSLDSRRAERIVSAYLLQFFERSLEGAPAPLLEARSRKAGPNDATSSADPAAHLQVWLPSRAGMPPDRRSARPAARLALSR
jgi:predicted dienelactone hydrolase